MKITTALLAAGLMAGELWAQNPNVIQNVPSTTNAVQQQKTNNSNAALGIKGAPAANPASKPAAGAPAKSASSAHSAAAKSTPASASVKTGPAPASAKVTSAKSQTAPAASKNFSAKPLVAVKVAAAPASKVAAKQAVKPATATTKITAKAAGKKPGKTVISAAPKAPLAAPAAPDAAVKAADAAKPPKPEEKKWAMNGKRDPFFSPVVQQPTGSGCSSGKKCLEIGSINLHGVVKSEAGFIAVVTNNLGKAYFLRENDPVFNGYVVRITGDTVVFQESYEDKLGKPLTREVVKRILVPAV